ncbi:MAG: hypothetical protein IJZ23_01470 [Roseburia sp.]|nr:hypothetical protein [Roseburia sp.]
MDALITLIMIGAFIYKLVKKADGRNEKKPAKQPVQQRQPVQKTTQAQRDAYYYNQQKATKERLQQKYGSQQKTVQNGTILSRAKENVQEQEASAIQQEMHAEVCREYREPAHAKENVKEHKLQCEDCDTGAESDILKKVNDLMITGYSGAMNFERDFIAEGVDMLNRFTI